MFAAGTLHNNSDIFELILSMIAICEPSSPCSYHLIAEDYVLHVAYITYWFSRLLPPSNKKRFVLTCVEENDLHMQIDQTWCFAANYFAPGSIL